MESGGVNVKHESSLSQACLWSKFKLRVYVLKSLYSITPPLMIYVDILVVLKQIKFLWRCLTRQLSTFTTPPAPHRYNQRVTRVRDQCINQSRSYECSLLKIMHLTRSSVSLITTLTAVCDYSRHSRLLTPLTATQMFKALSSAA